MHALRSCRSLLPRCRSRACSSLSSAVDDTIKSIRTHPLLLQEVLKVGDSDVRHNVLLAAAAEAFQEADEDGDGTISSDEVSRYLSLNRYPKVGAAVTSATGGSEGGAPSGMQLRRHAVLQFLPFVVFGMLDNGIMLLAGSAIEDHLGEMFALSTMMAAGLGNAFSDVIGVGAAGYIEKGAEKVLPDPEFTTEQARSSSASNVRILFQSVGIVIGCLIGVAPLLLMEDEETRRLRKLYESMDKNNDGRVSLGELENALHETGIRFSRSALEKVFAEIDADRSKHLSFQEFKEHSMRWKSFSMMSHQEDP